MKLTNQQLSVVEAPLHGFTFLEGPAGTGKTTTGVRRMEYLVEEGASPGSILLLFPQQTLANPYQRALSRPPYPPGTTLAPTTMGGITRRVIDLFWPLLLSMDLFPSSPTQPTFLTMESAQYMMSHLVRPLIEEQGFFESVSISPSRIYSQILDNLNKAAVVGFPSTQIGERLVSAWVGEPGRTRVYQDAQYCVDLFREFCIKHGLLDFSLQVEIFTGHLWKEGQVQSYLKNQYQHLIAENLEEDAPVFHDLLLDWLPSFRSALLIVDQEAGFRQFLGADPSSALRFKELADRSFSFEDSLVTPPGLEALEANLSAVILSDEPPDDRLPHDLDPVFEIGYQQYYPDMLAWTADTISDLLEEGCAPSQIAVLAPYLSDSVRFSLQRALRARGVQSRSHRPSRALREEPPLRCLLTLAALGVPEYQVQPSQHDVTHAFLQAFQSIDLIRAQVLSESVYSLLPEGFKLLDFEEVTPENQERITQYLGSRYQILKNWLGERNSREIIPLDHFLRKLFGEVISQPGFGFHNQPSAGEITSNLLESIQKFRSATAPIFNGSEVRLGREYLTMVRAGVIASQYIRNWRRIDPDAVILAPAYTFLMKNKPVDYQFWLDGGSRGWYERIYQPLTHPQVLSRHWQTGSPWTDVEEIKLQKSTLHSITSGLLRRCRL